MSHTEAVASPILRPGVRTFKPRRSRITARQQRALASPGPELLNPSTLERAWALGNPVVLDIGFGSADPVITLAHEFPDQVILAIDVHTPGIGDLVDRCSAESTTNVFVCEADVLELVRSLPGPLAGVRSFFPDPWPKARHHKRRLIQPLVLDAIYPSIETGGFWHIATDWPEYADSMIETFAGDSRWQGGVIGRPDWRPLTHFEKRAIREGRPVVDMWFSRI